jgi:hypothetical protein
MSLPARCDIYLLRRRQDRCSWRVGRPVNRNKSSCGMTVMVQASTGGSWPSLLLRRLAMQQFCPASNLRKLLTFSRLCTLIHDAGTAGLPGGQWRLFRSMVMTPHKAPPGMAGYAAAPLSMTTTSVIGWSWSGAGLEMENRGRHVVPCQMPRR